MTPTTRWCTPPHAATGLMRPSPVSPDDGGPRPHRQASGLPSWCQRPDRGVTGRRDRRPGPLQGLHHRLLPRPGPLRAPLRGSRPASRGPITKTREHPRPAPADRGRPDATPPPTGPPRPYGRAGPWPPHRSRNGPMPATAARRARYQALTARRDGARRGRHRHRPTERRLAVVPGNHGRLGPARPPRPARPERLNQVRRNHDLTHQTRSPARRGHTGRNAQGAHAHQLWAAPRGDARLQTSRAPSPKNGHAATRPAHIRPTTRPRHTRPATRQTPANDQAGPPIPGQEQGARPTLPT